MNEELYNVALKNALTEIKNACTDINWSFIISSDGTVVSGEDDVRDSTKTKAANSFQSLAQRAGAAGGLDSILIDADNGKVYGSDVNGMYFVAGLAKGADLVYFRTVTRAVLPTILKVLDSITSTMTPTPTKPSPFVTYPVPEPNPPEPTVEEEHEEQEKPIERAYEEPKFSEPEKIEDSEDSEFQEPPEPQATESERQPETVPSQQLIVDKFGGLMVRADTVQLDSDILKRWGAMLNGKEVRQVEIETFSGKTTRCKTKVINDPKLEGRGFIRIPDKTCQLLDLRRGELVRVKPVAPEESD